MDNEDELMSVMSTDAAEWVYGITAVSHALMSGRRTVLEIWTARNSRSARLRALMSAAGRVPVREVSSRELDRMCQGGVHQGVLARVSAFPWSELSALMKGEGPLLMLDGIQDPHNLGAIIRSSVAFGAKGIVMERRRSAPLSPVVAKSASGALEHVRLCRVSNLPRAIRDAKDAGHWVIGARQEGGMVSWEAEIPTPVALVVGGEGSGIRPIVQKGCDLWLSIPCFGELRTLNASVAAAVLLYELMRRGKGAHSRAGAPLELMSAEMQRAEVSNGGRSREKQAVDSLMMDR